MNVDRIESRTYINGNRDGEIREGEWQHITTVYAPPLTRWQRLIVWVLGKLGR